ncbi:DELLA protein [Quillaja saponaria]|uniref:DELLA protein n=1 Tax=Quillaja saponaria TaxID=32244 RepID=A0AAD7PB06_QUISA|nr:DELLA protein [Quillaja saponaria]
MEDINSWLSLPMYENLNHDFAIRRFCPARMEQEQGGECDEALVLDEIVLSSPFDATSTPCLASSEIDEFVDSFINVDHCDNDDNNSMENHQNFDNFQDDLEAYSMADDFFGNVSMMIDEAEFEIMNGCFEIVPDMVPSAEEASQGMDQGLDLVHMLLGCAEAVGCRDTQLAGSLLSKIWALASPGGDSLQRVSYCFATGLKWKEKSDAFQLLYQTTPYIAFGFMAANEAICQAAQGKSSLHIIDLGMEHTLQWPSLIRALASRPGGRPALRITGLTNDHNVLEIEASMKTLVEEANSLGMPMEFHLISEPATPSLLTKENLNLREGEALFFNSIMHLHKYVKESRSSLKAILQAIKKLSPTVLTVVEQDANHNGPFFLGRFLESLHYYSAIFDSLEASLPRNSPQRMKIERLRFAEEIRNIVAYEGPDRIERHERVDQWRRQLGRAGFQVVGLKCMSQARMMLSVYGCDGYTLATEKGCLLLGWKGRPIIMTSAWKVNNVVSSS